MNGMKADDEKNNSNKIVDVALQSSANVSEDLPPALNEFLKKITKKILVVINHLHLMTMIRNGKLTAQV